MHDRDSKRFRAWTVLRLFLALALGLSPTFGWAQDSPRVPHHAYIDFGRHWKCDRGFKRVEERCEEIRVPEHAFLTAWEDGWKCERRFKRVDDRCEEIRVPRHAFLDCTGNRWQCERGYKRTQNQCRAVQVPEHAFLTAWGDGWECERGFQRRGDHCARE